MPKTAEPTKLFSSQRTFETWLEANHDRSKGLWLQIAKRDAGTASVTYAEALDVALCFGWIDGQKEAMDERFWLQKFTPRKPQSRWSKVNRDKAMRLVDQGRVRPSGMREIERAKADGRWERAYEAQSRIEVPPDLADALATNPKARAFFETIDRQNRFAILYRVGDVKKPETRARRIATYVTMLAKGEVLYPKTDLKAATKVGSKVTRSKSS